MKKIVNSGFSAVVFALAGFSMCLYAETVTWDSDEHTVGAQDGGGYWNVSTASWWNGATNSVWVDGSDAVFGSGNGAGGIVTINAMNVKPNAITFQPSATGSYTLDASGPYGIDLGNGMRTVTVHASSAVLACGVTNGALTKRGTGTLVLSHANTYSGGTVIAAGGVSAWHAQALGLGAVSVAGGGTNKLYLSGSIAVTNLITLGSEAPSYGDNLRSVSGVNVIGAPLTVYQSHLRAEAGSTLRITHGIVGASYVSFDAAGTIQVEERPIALTNQTVYFGGSSAGSIRLNTTNNVFSSANLWGGVTLIMGAAYALPTNVNITANNSAGGKVDVNGFSQTVGSLNQNVNYMVDITNSGPSAIFTVNQNANTFFAGRISGALTMVKKGTGMLTLSNTTTFTGGTIISNGTLRLGVASALPIAGAVDIAGGIYDLGGFTVTNSSVTVRSGSVINGTLAAGLVELVDTGLVSVAISGRGNLRKSGVGTADVIASLTYAGTTDIDEGTLRLQPLPTGTVAFYGFDSETDLGLDLSAQGNRLKTLTGTPQYSAAGRFGGALYLNGSTTLGTLSGGFPAGVPTGAAPYTVSAFIKVESGCPTQGGWIGYGNQSNSQANNFRLGGTYTNVWNYWWANDFGATLPGGSFTDGWHSVVGTWNGTTERIYIDGVERASRAASGLNVGTNAFVIGRTIGDANFKGWVDELLIANRALSANEILALHTARAYNLRSLPATTTVNIAAGASLDLNQMDQAVAVLTGEGSVTGGVLTVTERIAAGSATGTLGELTIHSALTLADGIVVEADCTAAHADGIHVHGALTLQGAGTVQYTPVDPQNPTCRAALFSFDTITGQNHLSGWSVTGVPPGYVSRVYIDQKAMILSVSLGGTVITIR